MRQNVLTRDPTANKKHQVEQFCNTPLEADSIEYHGLSVYLETDHTNKKTEYVTELPHKLTSKTSTLVNFLRVMNYPAQA